jgi:hypothetical protein
MNPLMVITAHGSIEATIAFLRRMLNLLCVRQCRRIALSFWVNLISILGSKRE